MCALTWDDINFDSKTLSVNHTLVEKGKGQIELDTLKTASSYRTILIGDNLVKITKEVKKKTNSNMESFIRILILFVLKKMISY